MRIFQPTISGSTNTTGSLVITGSLRVSEGITGSLLGTASWAINVVNGGGGGSVGTLAQVTALGASTTTPITASIISASSFTGSLFGTASWALSASNAINARTASFVNNLNQNLSITGAVVLSGSALPELRVIGDTQFTGSINSLNGYTGSLFGTSSWAVSASRAISASFGPNIGNTNLTLTGNRRLEIGSNNLQFQNGGVNVTEFNSSGINITGSLWTLGAHIYGTNPNGAGKIFIYEAVNNGGNYVGLSVSGNLSNNVEFVLPTSTGSGNNIIMADDGNGQLYFTNQVPTASLAITASLASRNLLTASVSLNTITFTKGDGSPLILTIDTGSGGGGGSVTINNNVDNYIITATGTANTLNGESALQFSGSTLINTGKSRFGGATTTLTTHQFKGDAADTFASFLVQDTYGENTFKIAGSATGEDLVVEIGDIGGLFNSTVISIDDTSNQINLQGKVFATQNVLQDGVQTTNGFFTIGSKVATWSTTGPAVTAGRVVYLSGSGQWAQAQANVSGSSYGVLGVVTSAASQNEILLEGVIKVSGSALSGTTIGQPVYLSAATAGQITTTAPSTAGQISRIIGYVTDASNNNMYFKPDNSFTIIA